jgi:peptide/nickel transport system permease protein
VGAFFLRSALRSAVVIGAVLVLVFVMGRVIGDPTRLMLPLGSPPERYEELRRALGLTAPLPEQFVRTVGGWITGDFGQSIWQRVPAFPLALERLPATAYLAVAALLIALPTAAVLGIAAALRPRSAIDRFVTVISMIGVSVADFWLGLMLILLLAVRLDWLPTSGYGGPSFVLMPALTLSLPIIGRVTLVLRAAMFDELRKPYVATARSHGLSEFQVVVGHILRNASIPVVTVAGAEVIALLNGAIVVETIFAWPGIGKLLIDAIFRRDMPLVEATVFIITLTVVAANLAVDATYSRLDPRVVR